MAALFHQGTVRNSSGSVFVTCRRQNYMFQNHVTAQQDARAWLTSGSHSEEQAASSRKINRRVRRCHIASAASSVFQSAFIWLLQRFQQSLCCYGLAEHQTMETIIRRPRSARFQSQPTILMFDRKDRVASAPGPLGVGWRLLELSATAGDVLRGHMTLCVCGRAHG